MHTFKFLINSLTHIARAKWIPRFSVPLVNLEPFNYNLLFLKEKFTYVLFLAMGRLSLVAANGGHSSLQCSGFALSWLLLLQSPGSRSQTQWLWHLVALRHVGSSWTTDQKHVSCFLRQILNHWTTREVLNCNILSNAFIFLFFSFF